MVHHLLTTNQRFMEAINMLVSNKPHRKILEKAIEELSELTTKLAQHINNPKKVNVLKIAGEIVDVQMHLILLVKAFGNIDFSQITEDKVQKMLSSKEIKRYKHK